MHGDPQHGSSERIISVGDLKLTSIDHEAQDAQQPEGADDAEELRQHEDQRRGDDDPAGRRNAGDDAGWSRGDDSGLCGPADVDRGKGYDGRGSNAQPTQLQLFGDGIQSAGDRPEEVGKVHVFHVPVQALPKALELGAGQGVEQVILATDEETIQQVQEDLLTGRKQFWAATQHGEFIGCLISEIKQMATGTVLSLPYMAGKRPQDWLPLMNDMIEPLAEEVGCEAVVTQVREGMRKMLVDMGWRKTAVRMRRDLNGRQKQNGQ